MSWATVASRTRSTFWPSPAIRRLVLSRLKTLFLTSGWAHWRRRKGISEKPNSVSRRSQRLDPDCAEAYGGLAMIHQQRHEYSAAFEMYLKCLERDLDNLVALLGLFQTSCQMGTFGKIIHFLEIYLAKHPDDVSVIFCLASLYVKERDLCRAQAFLRRVVTLEPDKAEARELLEKVRNGVVHCQARIRQSPSGVDMLPAGSDPADDQGKLLGQIEAALQAQLALIANGDMQGVHRLTQELSVLLEKSRSFQFNSTHAAQARAGENAVPSGQNHTCVGHRRRTTRASPAVTSARSFAPITSPRGRFLKKSYRMYRDFPTGCPLWTSRLLGKSLGRSRPDAPERNRYAVRWFRSGAGLQRFRGSQGWFLRTAGIVFIVVWRPHAARNSFQSVTLGGTDA